MDKDRISIVDLLIAATVAGLACPIGLGLAIYCLAKQQPNRAAVFLLPALLVPAAVLATVVITIPQARKEAAELERHLARTHRELDGCPRRCW